MSALPLSGTVTFPVIHGGKIGLIYGMPQMLQALLNKMPQLKTSASLLQKLDIC